MSAVARTVLEFALWRIPLRSGPAPGLFFFSSRRRHTRFSRDWSSDACSSDLLEAPAHTAIVGGDVREPDPEALPGAEDDVGEVGLEPLDAPERLAVEAELERVLGPRMPGQLRVEHLVAPATECGRPLDPLEKVRDPAPAIRHEDGLVDVRRAGPHRLLGRPSRGLPVASLAQPDLDHHVAAGTQGLDEGQLVRRAFALKQFREGVLGARTCGL